MPLHDHFRPPISKRSSWEGFHGYWPAAMVQSLAEQLPAGYIAEPRVHLGSVTRHTSGSAEYAYEVLIYDLKSDRALVAAVKIACPANKDRAESRQTFVAKCASLLRKGVCVSIVDLVTVRNANLYAELLSLIERSDPSFTSESPPIYAVTCRKRLVDGKPKLETWSYALAVGQPLPTLPIWLTEHDAISLDLEASYEAACRVLRIG